MTDESSNLKDVFDFSFTTFVTPQVIRIVYILVVVFTGIGWLLGVISGFSQGFAGGLIAIIFVTLFAAIGLLMWRVILELTMVIFRIKQNTDNLDPSGTE